MVKWDFPTKRGTQISRSRLNETKVRAIRYRAARGEDWNILADEYGVTRMAIYHVVKRNTWRHVE